MSKGYDMYLTEHRGNVAKGFHWIQKHLPALLIDDSTGFDYEYQICFAHDLSKDDASEYDAYDAYFYGGNRSYQVVQNFNYAWLRHIHHNPHHWQYWILNCDEPGEGEIILDMPYPYILEMICDWWAFSWTKESLTEIFDWYEQHKEYMKLSEKTRRTVEDILRNIGLKLQELDTFDKTEKETEENAGNE